MNITMRNATLDDAELLLAWRNHPSTRKFSRQPEPINFEEHIEWLTARLSKIKIEPFYLFFDEFRPIGMSRLDSITELVQKFEISILVDPQKQGMGIGAKILRLTCENFFDLNPDYTIVAHINQSNFISQKLFKNAGFELLQPYGNLLCFEKSLD
jgi:RimJ/RimL family protein N-acetyltransferase